MPKISVIMPLYNAENYVKKTVESILKQTYRDFELIIINDCSTDRSLDIVTSFRDSRIRVLENDKNMGIAYTRNKALEIAEGKYIALMDDDDLTVPIRFALENDYLDMHNDIAVVGGRHCLINERDEIVETFDGRYPLHNSDYIQAYLMFYDAVANGSAMMRKDFVMDHGIKYQDDCYGMEDYLFWIECSVKGKITNLSDMLLLWRRGSNNNETKRILMQYAERRAEKFAQLHRYAFELNGYELSDEEYAVINRMFPETLSSRIATNDELRQLYGVFTQIINQAQVKQLSNAKEIKILCRKLFSKRLEFSELWF